MREPSFIPTERVRACLRERYGLGGVTLEFLPRGHDYRAGVYRVVSTHGAAYLLKVTSRPLYEPSCLIPRFLHEQGITAVVAPIPTKDGALWICLAEWTLLVYPFLDGETSLVGMTNEHWREVGTIFQRIHQTQLPPTGLTALRKETFDPTEYVRWVRAFEAQHLHTRDDGNEAARALRAAWGTHRATIHTAVVTLERLAGVLQAQALPSVICHADLHAANLLRDPAGQVYVLDWDEVMLAPKERDFIFIRGPQADAFWDGYGPHELDWTALTYFRWERVIQDLIEEARQVLFRDDVGEDAKAIAAQRFSATFAPGGNAAAAIAAAAHLPGELRSPGTMGSP